jgi:hypothetical protein
MEPTAPTPTREELLKRWARALVPCLLVPLIIWGVLDVPEDYDPCATDPPPGQDADLSEFRAAAYPLVGLLAAWLTYCLARWSLERRRRIGGLSTRVAAVPVALAWAGLGFWALEAADVVDDDNMTWGVLALGSLALGALFAAVSLILIAVVPAWVSGDDVPAARRQRAEALLLAFAASLLLATPLMAVLVGLAGSDFVIGC